MPAIGRVDGLVIDGADTMALARLGPRCSTPRSRRSRTKGRRTKRGQDPEEPAPPRYRGRRARRCDRARPGARRLDRPAGAHRVRLRLRGHGWPRTQRVLFDPAGGL